jgi:acyl carrier protein
VPLPTYPFERKRFWVDSKERAHPASANAVTRKLSDVLQGAGTAEAVDAIDKFLQAKIAVILGKDAAAPSPDASLFDFGIESLVLIELAARINSELPRPVPPTAFMTYPTIRKFATHVVETLDLGTEQNKTHL